MARQRTPGPPQPTPQLRPPPGYRDSGHPVFGPGEVVANTYQVRELLSTSRTGQVFEARDMLLDRMVAIKGAWRDSDVPTLMTEARALASIRDACAAAVYSMGHHHKNEFLVVERIAGATLGEHIAAAARGSVRIPCRDAVKLLALLTRGLVALHSAGLFAPYLSCRNLILLPGPRLVMAHLALGQGVPQYQQDQQDEPSTCMAPELAGGSERVTDATRAAVAVDLYALGCVAVELLTGAPPFAGATHAPVQQVHVHQVQQLPPRVSAGRDDVPAELDELVVELLARNPAQRPPSARHVEEQLRVLADRLTRSQRSVRVLVIDPEPGRARRHVALLRRTQATVDLDVALDADQALACIQQHRPDLILLDLGLAGSMNALELCMYVQGLETSPPCMLVGLCDRIKPGDAQVLASLGVSQLLSHGDSNTIPALVDIVDRVGHALRSESRGSANP